MLLSEKLSARSRLLTALLVLMPLAAAFASFCVGRYSVDSAQVFRILAAPLFGFEPSWSAMDASVVLQVRLPRILIALFAGAGLSVVGASLQTLFANPLASPDTLGVGSGASFGAACALLFSNNMLAVQASAMAFGLLAMFFTCVAARTEKSNGVILIVLSGIIVSAFFQALISLVKYVADTETKLPAITYWLMGSLANGTFRNILMCFPGVLAGTALVFALRWRMNILLLSDDEAETLGVKVKSTRIMIIVASTLVTASVVACCGQVGWVGLVVPHTARILVGTDNRKVVPVCISLGAAYLVVIDTLSRSLTGAEIPISILTALIGAPFFAVLLRRCGGSLA